MSIAGVGCSVATMKKILISTINLDTLKKTETLMLRQTIHYPCYNTRYTATIHATVHATPLQNTLHRCTTRYTATEHATSLHYTLHRYKTRYIDALHATPLKYTLR